MKFAALSIFSMFSFFLLASLAGAQIKETGIRSVDFENFTYAWPKDLADPKSEDQVFSLNNGELHPTSDEMGVNLVKVRFGDATGDGVEEALVQMSVQTGGSSIPGIVYVFSTRKGAPKLLWSFATGDRADGGLHDVYTKNGKLIVEIYGPKRKDEADGRLTRFTRTTYKWSTRGFRAYGKKRVIAIN